jgi:predicted nucleotidyltransferase
VFAAERMAQRAAEWIRAEPGVRAGVVYGSVARQEATEESDLDLILVAEPGERERLWERRRELAGRLHERDVVWAQEPSWQRPYRYQTWDDQLNELDLTFDEEHASAWHALRRGFVMIVDKADVGSRLTADVAALALPAFDAAAYDGGTWVWLDYLHGRLRRGETWLVRYGVMDTLTNRVVPLLGSAGHSVRTELGDGVVDRLNSAAPASGDVAELRRSLLATAELYDWALGRWAKRTGQPKPRSVLAAPILARLRQQEPRPQ